MRIKLFSYLTIDYKAAEALLNRMAAEGWALKRLFLGLFAIFERTERTDLRYFVDFGDRVYYEAPDYLTLCADAGWVSVGCTRSMNLYASAPGTEPVPLQTDSALEYERFRKLVLKRVRTSGIVYLVFIPLLLFIIWSGFSSFWPNLCMLLSYSYFFALFFFFLPALFIGGGIYMALLLSRVREWERLAESGAPLPVPEPRGALGRSILTLLGYAFLILFEFCYSLELVLNGDFNGRVGVLFLLIAAALTALTLFIVKKYFPRRRTTPGYSALLLCGITLLLFVNLFFPASQPFQPTPVLPVSSLVDPEISVNTRGGFLGQANTWSESLLPEYREAMWVELHTLRYAWLADGMQDYLWVEGMEPVPGRVGVWQADAARNFLYHSTITPFSSKAFTDWRYTLLLRRENSILLIEYPKDMPQEALLAYVDAWQ